MPSTASPSARTRSFLPPRAVTGPSGYGTSTSRKLITRLVGHRGSAKRVAFSPDGHHLASASVDTTARIWDLSKEDSTRSKEGRRRDQRCRLQPRRQVAGYGGRRPQCRRLGCRDLAAQVRGTARRHGVGCRLQPGQQVSGLGWTRWHDEGTGTSLRRSCGVRQGAPGRPQAVRTPTVPRREIQPRWRRSRGWRQGKGACTSWTAGRIHGRPTAPGPRAASSIQRARVGCCSRRDPFSLRGRKGLRVPNSAQTARALSLPVRNTR